VSLVTLSREKPGERLDAGKTAADFTMFGSLAVHAGKIIPNPWASSSLFSYNPWNSVAKFCSSCNRRRL